MTSDVRKRIASDIQEKRWISVAIVKYKPGPLESVEEVTSAMNYVIGSLTDVLDLAADVPVINADVVEGDVSSNLRDLNKNERL